MEFAFRAGDRSPRRPSPDRRFTPPQAGPFHGEPPPPSPFEWEAAARRERVIREEVERRLVEEEVRRELALARARGFHGGFGPASPFVGPGGPIVPPPPPGPFFMPDGPFVPPMPLPMMPAAVAMHPNWPPPPPPQALFGSWEEFGSRRLAGFGQPMLPNETRTRPPPPPPPKPRHQLQLREIASSAGSEVLSSETKVTKLSGVKRKAYASSAATKPTKLQNLSSTTTEPTKLQNAVRDWSCALCQVSATSEAGLNQHLEGKKHKAKLVQCGAIKVTDTNKSGLHVITRNNNNGAGPSDAPKKIHILVDGEIHQVVQKSNYLWCGRCRVSCTNNVAMADHLRGKKHGLLNKVWKSIKAVRMTKEVKEDSAATCERKVNENCPTGIPEEHKEMTRVFSGDGSFEISMEMKETTDMTEEVDANSHHVNSVEKEDTGTASKVNRNCPAENKQEGTDVVVDVNKNFLLNVHQKSRNKPKKNFLSKVHQKSRKKANKKFLLKVHQKSRKKASKHFLLKAIKSRTKAEKWLGIREVNEQRHNDETTTYAGSDLAEPARKEE